MKLITMAAAAALLAGCATPAPAPSELTNVQLCEAFFYAAEPYASAAGQEATSRGVRCPEYRDAVAQYRQDRESARWQAAGDWLQRNPVAPPPAVNCRSYRVSAQVQTTCQ